MNKQFTPDQALAIETLDRHCVVIAGPGAGKTRVLVERALHALHDAALEDIAAITFTNKAANEMKERLKLELGRLARTSKNRADARHWLGLKRRIEHAEIATVHGFCASILRAQPVEAGVDPAFSILDDYTGRLLLLQSAEAAVNKLLESQEGTAARLIIGYSRPGLVDVLVRMYAQARSLGLSIADIEHLTLKHMASAPGYAEVRSRLETLVDGLLTCTDLTVKMQEQLDGFRAAWQVYSASLPDEPDLAASSRFDEATEHIDKAAPHAKGRWKDRVKEFDDTLQALQLIFYDVCSGPSIKTFVHALQTMEQHYLAEKQARHALDYEDLQWKVRDLFRNCPWVARRYAERFKFIFVDEFQDTNSLQKHIIDLLSFGREHANNLFIVGDAAQSIYNFRGAEVEVFESTARELVSRGALEIHLKENFRSTPALIRFFNAFFARVMRLEPGDDETAAKQLGYVSYFESRAHRSTPEFDVAVEVLLEIGDHIEKAEDARELEAERIAARIQAMVANGEKLVAGLDADGRETTRAVGYGDVAILFRAMTDIKVYEQALRRAGVPYYILAGKGFYEREEIQDVLSVLKFLENRTDEIALVSALRSPLFGISDETLYWLRFSSDTVEAAPVDHHPMLTSVLSGRGRERIGEAQWGLVQSAAGTIARWLELRNRISLAELLEEIFRATDYVALQTTYYDGYQRVANLSKLVELARGFESSGAHFLSDFIRFVQQFTEMESREAEAQLEMGMARSGGSVQIMTIHKAKGLEFPVVILPDLTRKLASRSDAISFDRSIGIGLRVPDTRGHLHETALRSQVTERIRRRELFETQRLLFVAVTRARDYLIFSGADKSVKADRSPYEASCYLEWLFNILPLNDHLDSAAGGSMVMEWEGIPIRISAGGQSVETVRARSRTVVEQYEEIRRGLPCARAGAVDESVARARDRIVKRLNPIAIPPSISYRPLAVTRFLSFARCPLQFYYETVLGLPESDQFEGTHLNGDGSSSGELAPLVRGRIVHRFCELYDGRESPDQAFDRALDREGIIEPETKRQAKLALWPLVEHYLKGPVYKQIDALQKKREKGSARSELGFIYHTEALLLRGRIDKLLIRQNGEADLIDIKTNRIGSDQVETAAREYELQMRVYAMAARKLMHLEKLRVQLYFLEPDVLYQIDEKVLDAEHTETLLNQIGQSILQARHTGVYTAAPEPGKCRRCRSFSYCPARAES